MWTTFEIFFFLRNGKFHVERDACRRNVDGKIVEFISWRFAKISKYGFCTAQNIHWCMICLLLIAKNIDADGDHCVITDQWIRSARRGVFNKISLNQWVGNELPHSLSFGSTYSTKVSHKFNPVGVSPKKFTQQIYIVPFCFIPRPIPLAFVYSLVRFPFIEIWFEFVADHDTKLGSYKLSFNTLVLAWQLANLTISVTKFSFKGRIMS